MMFVPLEELDYVSSVKVPRVHGAVAPGEPLAAALEELDIVSVAKVRRVHGAGVPVKPLVGALVKCF